MKADVVVIGGGVAGATAALAARDLGRSVALVRRAPGATALASGLVDVAPDPTARPDRPFGEGLPLAACVEALAARRPHHPYAVLGETGRGRLGEALGLFSDRLGDAGLPVTRMDPAAPPRVLPGPFGGARFAAGALASMDRLDLREAAGARVGVATLAPTWSLDAELLRAGLAALGVEARAVAAAWPDTDDAPFLQPFDLARLLDDAAGRDALAEALRPGVDGLTHLLLPAVAGTVDGAAVCDALGDALGLAVLEVPGAEASVPGLRLHRALERALAAAGVESVVGTARRKSDGLVLVRGRGREEAPLEAEAVVLATGRYVGGGIERTRAFAEPVFGLPVWVGDAPVSDDPMEHLTRDEIASPQPLFHAGVAVDAELRPLTSGRRPLRDDLFAAGEVVGGYDARSDGTGLGTAILTGYLAGRRAAGSA